MKIDTLTRVGGWRVGWALNKQTNGAKAESFKVVTVDKERDLLKGLDPNSGMEPVNALRLDEASGGLNF
jgi:hypothetical protein